MLEDITVAPLRVQADLEHRLKKDTGGEMISSDIKLNRALNIRGWMTEAELDFLARTAHESKLIYEIGSYHGRSTRAMADNTSGVIHAIDPWNVPNFGGGTCVGIAFTTNPNDFNQFYCNLADVIEKNIVIPEINTWADFIPPAEADFIFIDGDHRYESVRHDILKALRNIAPGGIIAGHDYHENWPGVVK